ncbi:MAG TPA: tetratricopeptide repeat protein, partial [Verrucomicrobiae bacterium]|nr:tetratricopeptide repeat protein [Verrucomicrobiae bacterium]
MQKEPKRRYASATALAEDLRRFAAGQPIRARPVGLAEWTVKWVRRRPSTAALITALMLLVVGLSGAAAWYVGDRAERRTEETLRGQQVNRDADASLADAESHLQDIRTRLEDPLKASGLLSDIELWQTTKDKARQAWQRASTICTEHERFVDPSTLSRLRKVAESLLCEEIAYRLAKELDDIKSYALMPINGKIEYKKAMPEYAAFFARQGLVVNEGDQAQFKAELETSSIRLVLAAAFDHWAEITANEDSEDPQLARLLELARIADPDPWRTRFRDPAVWRNRIALIRLANEVKVEQQTPTILTALANRLLPTSGKPQSPLRGVAWVGSPNAPLLASTALFPLNFGVDGSTIYHRALLSHPRDFWLHWNAATHAVEPAEKIGLYLAAIAVRPESVTAHTSLGSAFRDKKDLVGAIAACNRAIDINPNYGPAYVNLGAVLSDKKDQAGALVAFKKAIKLDPKIVEAHVNLGIILRKKRDQAGAMAAFKEAMAVNSNYAPAFFNYGAVLLDKNDLRGAITAFERTTVLDPNYAMAYNNLAIALHRQKDLPGAIAAYRKAIELYQ